MATYRKRGDSWRAEVKLFGTRASATFPLKAEAVAWATETETEIRAKRYGFAIAKTVRQALEEYANTISPTHAGEHWERVRLGKFARDLPFVGKLVSDVQRADIARWRDSMTELAPETRRREYGLLRAVFAACRDEWEWIKTSPFEGLKPPAPGKPRKQRWTDADILIVQQALGYQGGPPEYASHYIALAMALAVETAMRKGELLSLDADNRVASKLVHLFKTKNGDERDVPLSTKAREVLDLAPSILVSSDTFDTLFRRARDAAAKEHPHLAGLHFHDLRREATTRLAAKLDPLTLAKVTGHKDLKILLARYYAPKMEDVADRLD